MFDSTNVFSCIELNIEATNSGSYKAPAWHVPYGSLSNEHSDELGKQARTNRILFGMWNGFKLIGERMIYGDRRST
jgi:hypothetical protein